MKVRKEISGLHYFNRVTGLHILMDEIMIPKEQIQQTPRTVSIALTNVCDLKCHFCYAPKNRHTLAFDYLISLCKQLDSLGVLEITFGGGEPTLYPKFEELCSWVWENTSLGISFTTHGHHINDAFINNIRNKVSSIRFSIDGSESRYSDIRGKNLDDVITKIKSINGQIPFGINCVVSKGQTEELKKVIELAINLQANNVLIIPEHTDGVFQITLADWEQIDKIIKFYNDQIELLVTYEAGNYLKSKTLEVSSNQEYLFAHISADNRLKQNSFDNEGILIQDINELNQYFLKIKTN